jgi:DNA-binding winged helix-turn-helix (wHTH) protein
MIARFAPFTLDDGRRTLTRDGIDVHVTPKAFDLLVLLVSQTPRVVPKSELHRRLWPDSYVSDATLLGLVKEVRRALDDGSAPSRIRTVHRVGYAVAAVLEPGSAVRGASARHWLVLSDRAVVLAGGDNVIGREPSAAVCLGLAGVSRRHARVVVADDTAILEDLGSKNGTKVGGRVVRSAVALRDGDQIQIGPSVLVYRMAESGLSTETHVSTEAL